MIAVLMGGNYDGQTRDLEGIRHHHPLIESINSFPVSICFPIRMRSRTRTAYYDLDPDAESNWKFVPYWARKT